VIPCKGDGKLEGSVPPCRPVPKGLGRVIRKGSAMWDQQHDALPAGQVAVMRALAPAPEKSVYLNNGAVLLPSGGR
jgi:hypothetical protein